MTPDAAGGTTGSAIVPGAVNRTSMALVATYDVGLRLSYATGRISATSTMTVTNRSGAGIDRIELNAVAARLGRLHIRSLTVDGVAVHPAVTDQTIRVPLGGVLPDGATTVLRIAFSATARSSLAGSNWLFTRTNGVIQLYRWLPWISRATRFNRPNHGDPFVTVSSPSVTVRITTDRTMRLATSGRRVATDRANVDLDRPRRPRLHRRRQPVVDRPDRPARSDLGARVRVPWRQRPGGS